MAVLDFKTSQVFQPHPGNSATNVLLIGLDAVHTRDLTLLGLKANALLMFSDIGALKSEALALSAPETIVSPLIAEGFDAIDIASRLSDLRYAGEYRIICQALPSETLVEHEIRNAAPDLEVQIITLPERLI